MSESDIQRDIRIALGQLPDLRIFRNNVGQAKQGTSVVRYGLAIGSSDLIGVLSPSGRFVALEVKTATGRTAEAQHAFLAMVRVMGGFGAIVRSVPDALAAIDRARAGASE